MDFHYHIITTYPVTWDQTSSLWSGDKTSQTVMTMHGLDCRFLEVAGIFMFTVTVSRMALKPI
jgi:hypothetical protein